MSEGSPYGLPVEAYSRAVRWVCNGTSNYLQADLIAPLLAPGGYSLLVWLSGKTVTGNQMLWAINTSAGGNRLLMRTDGSAAKNYIDFFGQFAPITGTRHATTNVCDGGLHCAIYTLDASGNLELYVDGVHDFSATSVPLPGASSDTVQLGAEYDAGVIGDWWDGDLHEGAAWGRVLTSAEALHITSQAAPFDLRPQHAPRNYYWFGNRDISDGGVAVDRGADPMNGAYVGFGLSQFAETGYGV